jgi:dolichol-phosphate mannosyltransferase
MALAPNIFVVPAYNEEANILRLLADLQSRPALFPPGSRVVVVDDGSTDDTAALVATYEGWLPVQLVRLRRNSGPGAAFRAGFTAALSGAPDDALVVTLEADTTSDLDALPAMLARAASGADLVLAKWKMVNVGVVRRVLSEGAAVLFRRALGVQAHTVSSFFRVYRASVLRTAHERHGEQLIREAGFACKAELLSKLAALGARIDEHEVALDWSRRNGESKMPVLRTIAAYSRMVARERRTRGAVA